MTTWTRICAALLPLLLLPGCLFTPGAFTSSLDVRRDGSFTFAYVGEVIVTEPSDQMVDAAAADGEVVKSAAPAQAKSAQARKEAAQKLRATADTLSKEKGFRSVRIVGTNKLSVDYQISGRLDHSFVFPFNIDAKAIIPFVAVEVRSDGKVRMMAPGFGNDSGGPSAGPMGGMPGMDGSGAAKERSGTFTLTTDAEIISQNQEDGAKDSPRGKQIVWTITADTRAAPMAVLKLAP